MVDFRRRLLYATIWAALLVWQATADFYDESIPLGLELYENSVDTGTVLSKSKDSEADQLLDTILQKLGHKDSDQLARDTYWQRWDSSDETTNSTLDSEFTYPVMKRVNDKKGPAKNVQSKVLRSIMKSPSKWQSRKGTFVGSNMVCYFKLCAFRRPAN